MFTAYWLSCPFLALGIGGAVPLPRFVESHSFRGFRVSMFLHSGVGERCSDSVSL